MPCVEVAVVERDPEALVVPRLGHLAVPKRDFHDQIFHRFYAVGDHGRVAHSGLPGGPPGPVVLLPRSGPGADGVDVIQLDRLLPTACDRSIIVEQETRRFGEQSCRVGRVGLRSREDDDYEGDRGGSHSEPPGRILGTWRPMLMIPGRTADASSGSGPAPECEWSRAVARSHWFRRGVS